MTLDMSLLGRTWIQTADGRIRCARCDEPSEQVVFRRRYVEDDHGRDAGTIRRSGPLCPACDAEEAQQ